MLEVSSLSFDYQDYPLLNQISFAVPPKTVLHLKGDNGVGKTTLLKLLAGFFNPLVGDICWQNHSIYQNITHYQQNLCYVGHKSGITKHLTVEENCFFNFPELRSLEQLHNYLEAFSLNEYTHRLCGELSAGQQRRLALLRLFVRSVPIWLLDEPFVALDQSATQVLLTYMKKHLEAGGLVILTSHQPLKSEFSDYQEYKLC